MDPTFSLGTPTALTPEPENDPAEQFGTTAFFAALGRAFVAMCALIPVLYLIELLDGATHHHLDAWGGIKPHEVSGLDGIVFAPFLHANFTHLYSNSVPLIITGTFVLARGMRKFLLSTGLIALVSGLGAWLIGSSGTVIIGASGIIFGYIGYLLVRGIIERSGWGISVGLLIGLLYGTQIAGVLPTDERISWQAHLFGLFGGVLAAILFRRKRARGSSARASDIKAPNLAGGSTLT
jgi:membrane associated rhomboid family serine protease